MASLPFLRTGLAGLALLLTLGTSSPTDAGPRDLRRTLNAKALQSENPAVPEALAVLQEAGFLEVLIETIRSDGAAPAPSEGGAEASGPAAPNASSSRAVYQVEKMVRKRAIERGLKQVGKDFVIKDFRYEVTRYERFFPESAALWGYKVQAEVSFIVHHWRGHSYRKDCLVKVSLSKDEYTILKAADGRG